MTDDLCTVKFAADQLNLHPKTVLRFIREGRLKATRIGKAYRIRRADLDAFAGLPPREQASTQPPRATCIVDVPGVGAELAQKWARTVTNALNAKPRESEPMRADVTYDAERSHLKIVIVGAPRDTMNLLGLISIWLEQLE